MGIHGFHDFRRIGARGYAIRTTDSLNFEGLGVPRRPRTAAAVAADLREAEGCEARGLEEVRPRDLQPLLPARLAEGALVAAAHVLGHGLRRGVLVPEPTVR